MFEDISQRINIGQLLYVIKIYYIGLKELCFEYPLSH